MSQPSPVKVYAQKTLTLLIFLQRKADTCAVCLSAKVKEFLKESLRSQNSAVTLAHIAALERKLTKHFHIKDFLSLERGTFLDFLVKNIQVQLGFFMISNK